MAGSHLPARVREREEEAGASMGWGAVMARPSRGEEGGEER